MSSTFGWATCVDIKDGQSYRMPQIPGKDPTPRTVRHRLFIDNRDCTDINTSPFSFKVYLSDPFRENSIGVARFERVASVELKALAFPKIANEHFVVMNVDELNDDRLYSSNNAANRSFAVAYFDADNMTSGVIKPIKGFDFYQKDLTFNPPLSTLSALTVSFKKADGTVVTGADTGNVKHCSFMLEIVTLQN